MRAASRSESDRGEPSARDHGLRYHRPMRSTFGPLAVFFLLALAGCSGSGNAPATARALECPAGSTFDGRQCIRNLVVTNVACPTGSTWDGAQCVGKLAAACGEGLHLEGSRGCVANDSPPEPPSVPGPTKPDVAPPPTSALGPFDRGAAAMALGVAAQKASSCAKPGSPSRSTHVQITYSPSGEVSSAKVDGPPYAGTPEGGCIAAKFRTAKVPPFSGAPVTVGKSLSVP